MPLSTTWKFPRRYIKENKSTLKVFLQLAYVLVVNHYSTVDTPVIVFSRPSIHIDTLASSHIHQDEIKDLVSMY
jgi:hypothetical protein